MDKSVKRTRLLTWVIIILLAVNLCVSCGVIVYLAYNKNLGEKTTCYTLYIGTNDKDTYTQLISLDEAREIVNNICVKYVDGYTVTAADGGWVDETGTLTTEETLIYRFTGVEEEAIFSIMDEVLAALNQSAILVETSEVYSFYYYGE